MSRYTFQNYIGGRSGSTFLDEAVEGWCLHCGYDYRGYSIFIQRAADEKQIMVRAGCRYFTLKQAMKHWGTRKRGKDGKQILQLIEIGLRGAVWHGLIKQKQFPKNFSTKLAA